MGFAVAAAAEIDAQVGVDLSLQVATETRVVDAAAWGEHRGAHGEEIHFASSWLRG